uniref:Glycosyltransferase 2-like domain-containing protein n=1 Tax=Glossina pallidipes TaxID=7398 RepID=A0A1A9Z0G4_GLOPL
MKPIFTTSSCRLNQRSSSPFPDCPPTIITFPPAGSPPLANPLPIRPPLPPPQITCLPKYDPPPSPPSSETPSADAAPPVPTSTLTDENDVASSPARAGHRTPTLFGHACTTAASAPAFHADFPCPRRGSIDAAFGEGLDIQQAATTEIIDYRLHGFWHRSQRLAVAVSGVAELELNQYNIEVVFINDGSTDNTESLINVLEISDPMVKAISFTRNFGKEPALFAGLEHATGDAIISIDMIEKWRAGADVVLAKRIDRTTDGKLKRKTAEWFYRLHNKISTQKIEEHVGDFRLISREVVENITCLPERNLFMKGLLSWMSGKVEMVTYTRAERSAGSSKFSWWKLWNLALEGITSFSTIPLRMWTYIGFGVASLSFLYGLWMTVDKLLFGNPVPGYPSLMVAILFIGGVQLIGIGVLAPILSSFAFSVVYIAQPASHNITNLYGLCFTFYI